MRTLGKVALAVLAVGFAVACADRATTPTKLNPAIHSTDTGNGVANYEELELCKAWSPASDVVTGFDVTVGNDKNAGGATTSQSYSFNDGQCTVVAKFDGTTDHFQPASSLQILENLPAGTELVSITAVQIGRNGASGATITVDAGTPTASGGNMTLDFTTGTWTASSSDNDYGYLVTYTDRVTPVVGDEGCTPGYWKNHAGIYSISKGGQKKPSAWQGYSPTDSYDATFGVTSSFGGNLIEALNRGGGGEIALGRHAVAALLNAASSNVSYPLTEAQIIALVQAAYASGDFENAKNTLATYNEQLCPL